MEYFKRNSFPVFTKLFPVMNAFSILMSTFQVFGILPISFHNNRKIATRNDKILEIWSIIIIVLNLTLTVAVVHYRDEVMMVGDEIGIFNVFIKFLTVFASGYVTLIETIYHRDHIKKFYQKIESFSNEFQRKGLKIRTRLERSRMRCLYWFIFIQSITIFKSVLDIFIFMKKIDIVYYATSTVIPYGICQIKSFQLCLALVEMSDVVKEYNNGLREIVQQSMDLKEFSENSKFFKYKYENFIDSILFYKQKYLDSKLLSTKINIFFGWSVTFNFIQIFVITTSDLYWIYYKKIITQDKNATLEIVPAVLNQFTTLLAILNTVSAAESYYNEADISLGLLHQIERNKDDFVLNDLVLNFSLQFKYAKVKFTAHDFFKISNSLVGSVSICSNTRTHTFTYVHAHTHPYIHTHAYVYHVQ